MSKQTIILSDWSAGVQSVDQSPLDFPQNAVVSGQNFEIKARGLRVRDGCSITSSGDLPTGDVVALEQVRFPTNEQSYLVAQVNPTWTLLLEDDLYSGVEMAWDSVEERLFLCIRRSPFDYYTYEPTTGTWRWGDIADEDDYFFNFVYDPDNERAIGYYHYSGGIYGNTLNLSTWEFGGSIAGTVPVHDPGTETYEMTQFLRNGKLIFCSGKYADGGSENFWIYQYDLDTHTGVELTDAALWSEDSCAAGIAYDPDDDVMYLLMSTREGTAPSYTSCYTYLKKYDFGTDTWTTVESYSGVAYDMFSLMFFEGNVLLVGGRTYTSTGDTNTNDVVVFDASTGERTVCPMPPRDDDGLYFWSSACMADDGTLYVWTANPGTTGGKLYSSMGWADPTWRNKGLFATPEYLPATSADWSFLYDLGEDAGTVSMAVLNDRAIFTDSGFSAFPLVWSGCLAEDGSDWAYPLHVLIRQDGEHYYDVSSYVLDKDSSVSANIGGIGSLGGIAICTDVPNIEGFYLQMGTANTLARSETTTAASVAWESTDDTERRDLAGGIAKWRQDSAETGHFEGVTTLIDNAAAVNKGGTPNLVGIPCTAQPYSTGDLIFIRNTTNYNGTKSVHSTSSTNEVVIESAYTAEMFGGTETINQLMTLGAGNDCPYVEDGLEVTIGGAPYYISDIAGDGEASGEVTLTTSVSSGDVSSIYGLTVSNNRITTTYAAQQPLEVYTKSAGPGPTIQTVRIILTGASCAPGGTNPRFTFSTATWQSSLTSRRWCRVAHASIVERSSGANGTTTPTQITFNNGSAGFTLYGKEQTVQSDTVWNYTIDSGKDYLVILDTVGYGSFQALDGGSGAGYYSRAPYVTSLGWQYPTSWNQATVTLNNDPIYGFRFNSGQTVALTAVDLLTIEAQVDQMVVGHTNDNNRFESIYADGISGVSVSQSTPGSSKIYHAVSMDNRATYQVFVDSAWRVIVQESGGNWQYNNSATTTPNWVNATVNSLLGALEKALAISYNQWEKTDIEAMDEDDWSAEDGFIRSITTFLEWGHGLVVSGSDRPTLTSYTIDALGDGGVWVQGWRDGRWVTEVWTDGTEVSDITLAQNGVISCDTEGGFTADYHTLNGIPGYWYLIKVKGTSASTELTRLLYKAPCQPLQNIGLGQPDTALGFVHLNGTTGLWIDYAVVMADETITETSSAPLVLTTSDKVYVGGLTKFEGFELSPYVGNTNSSVLSVAYWDGEEFGDLDVEDGTAYDGATMATRGIVSFAPPSDWKECIPLEGSLPRGYWLELTVSANFSANTAIGECDIFPVPDTLAKHKYVETFKDRVALISRPDALDQIAVSRELAEYGFTGYDSGSYRVGGTDGIHCAVAAWDGLFLGKNETWHQLTGSSPDDFSFQQAESGRHIPINSQVICRAPVPGSIEGTKYGLYFINRYGAYVTSGLHTDALRDTSRGAWASQQVGWWDPRTSVLPRLDLDYLYQSCGVYWPLKNWVLWSVPMIVSGSSQTTNNRLLVFDLSLQAWLPLFTITAASLTTAYHYNANAPGKLGSLGLYAGDYSGRVLRILDPSATDDMGTDIVATLKGGPLDLGAAYVEKRVRMSRLIGSTTNDATVSIYTDGSTTAAKSRSFPALSALSGRAFAAESGSETVPGMWHQLELEVTGPADIHGIVLDIHGIRERQGQ
jgi:hypothetical protein